MIAPAVIAEVRRLLAEDKLSQRKISRVTGVSRGTVSAIAAGRRPDYPPRAPQDGEEPAPSGRAARCPRCGSMVFLPCRLCRARAARRGQGGRAPAEPLKGEGLLELELKPEHRVRYEQVTARYKRLTEEE